jgi:C_GCAxxG_C_C family probable redox protein
VKEDDQVTHVERALECYREGSGFTCAHSVLSAFAPDFNMGDNLARAAAIFGGGVARTGGMCGGITGALMVLGLKYGMVVPEDQETKEKGYEIAKEFISRFAEKHGAVTCRELLGHDPGTPEGQQAIGEANLKTTVCTKVIKDAIEILEEFL